MNKSRYNEKLKRNKKKDAISFYINNRMIEVEKLN
jgi:hypothetical protein